MLQYLHFRIVLAAVLVAVSGSLVLAASPKSSAVTAVEERPPSSLAPMPVESRQFLQRGQDASLSDQEIESLINQFERDLQEIYSELSGTLAPLLDKNTLTKDEKAMLAHSLRKAAGRIATITQTALKPFALSDAELLRLLPTFAYFSHATKLSIRRAYPETNEDARDEVIMAQPTPLLYFFAGLSRRVGLYIDIKQDKRVIGNAFIVNFPAYFISRSGHEELTGMREDIRRFLVDPRFSDVVSALYELDKQQFRMVRLRKSAAYAMSESAGYNGMYGTYDLLDGLYRMLIHEDNICDRTKRLGEKSRADLQRIVEIHEMMHDLHRARQPACADAVDKRSEVTNLEESQAEVATLAVLAHEQHDSLNFALYMQQYTGWSNPPRLIYDDFYHGILTAALQRKFLALRAPSTSSAILNASQIPTYLRLAPVPLPTAMPSNQASISLGLLRVEGKEMAVFVDVDHLKPEDRLDLLFEVTPQDLLVHAHAALAKVSQLEQRLCQ